MSTNLLLSFLKISGLIVSSKGVFLSVFNSCRLLESFVLRWYYLCLILPKFFKVLVSFIHGIKDKFLLKLCPFLDARIDNRISFSRPPL